MNHKLSLRQHCIEMAIKIRYNQAVSTCFKSGDNLTDDLVEATETFREALETFDFGSLRNQYPDLRGNSRADVILVKDVTGRIGITINGKTIEP